MNFNIGDNVRIKEHGRRGIVLEVDRVSNSYYVWDIDVKNQQTNWYNVWELELIPVIQDNNNSLNELWEMVKRLELTEEDGGMSYKEIMAAFNYGGIEKICRNYTAEEALAKYRVWKENFKVGDELRNEYNDNKSIITKIVDDNRVYVLWSDGSSGIARIKDDGLQKTGKRYNIEELLYRLNERED